MIGAHFYTFHQYSIKKVRGAHLMVMPFSSFFMVLFSTHSFTNTLQQMANRHFQGITDDELLNFKQHFNQLR